MARKPEAKQRITALLEQGERDVREIARRASCSINYVRMVAREHGISITPVKDCTFADVERAVKAHAVERGEDGVYRKGAQTFERISNIIRPFTGYDDGGEPNIYAMAGTIVHAVVAGLAIGFPEDEGNVAASYGFPEEAAEMAREFREAAESFVQQLPSKHRLVEVALEHFTYAGTLDMIVMSSDTEYATPTVYELKTGKPHAWHQLQLAAQQYLLRRALFLTTGRDVDVNGFIIYLSRTGWRAVPQTAAMEAAWQAVLVLRKAGLLP